MPLSASLKITLNGLIVPGAGQQNDRKGEIPVIAATHQVKSDINVETGQPKADRTHSPFVITKKLDQSTPYLLQALRDNITFTNWDLRFFHMPSSGPEWNYANVKLTNARIIAIKMIMPHSFIPGNANIQEWEEVSFQYDSIGWSYRKHQSDPSTGNNANDVVEANVVPNTDFFENEAKAMVLGVPKLILQAKKALYAEYKAKHPAANIPPEYQ